MKGIAIGVQTFADIRANKAIYVDKTKYVHKMVSSSMKTFFLARPRRFGKSLMTSTLASLFSGQKELFEGLYVFDKWDFEQVHPVIWIDMSATSHNEADMMEKSLSSMLKLDAERNGMTLVSPNASNMFGEYIQKTYEKTGKQVVILIDEYDCPITDVLGNSGMIDANRLFLQTFYKQLKANDRFIRFIFITGITKFAKLALFSTLNNPQDITFSDKYAAICGFTQEELEANFPEHIDKLANKYQFTREKTLAKIKEWYDGYTWDGQTHVYNPVSTTLLLESGYFKNYWFNTGTPTFLVNELRDHDQLDNILDPIDASEELLDVFTPENLGTIPLLFQTGYLTIKSVELIDEIILNYKLGLPNEEVRKSFVNYLFTGYSQVDMATSIKLTRTMAKALSDCDESLVAQCMQTVVQNVPSILHIGNEKYYHSLFVVWMLMLGFRIDSEILTANGRIDAVLEHKEQVVICEIKYDAEKDKSKLLAEAMKQISDRRYYEKYVGLGKRILLLGLSFTGLSKEVGCTMQAIE